MMRRMEWWEPGAGYYDASYFKENATRVSLQPNYIKRQVDYIIRRLRLKKSDRILEIACGAGQVSIELARRGYMVVASDINPGFLRRARRAAGMLSNRAQARLSFAYANMDSLPFSQKFTAVILCGSSVGQFKNERQNRRAFSEMAKVLLPGGKVLLETWTCPIKRDRRSKSNPHHWVAKMPGKKTVSNTSWYSRGRGNVLLEYSSPRRRVFLNYKIYAPGELRRIWQRLGLRPQPATFLRYWKWQQTTRSKSHRQLTIAIKPRAA